MNYKLQHMKMETKLEFTSCQIKTPLPLKLNPDKSNVYNVLILRTPL